MCLLDPGGARISDRQWAACCAKLTGTRDRAAAHAADAMVGEHAVMIGEGWLIQHRREPLGKVSRMDQHHRLPSAPTSYSSSTPWRAARFAPLCHDLPP